MTKKDNLVQYAYALDDQGNLTHINTAKRSVSYTCPGCNSPLVPVLGEFNAKHFRHYEECCSLESYLHHSAKEAFFFRYHQSLKHGEAIKLELKRSVYCNGVNSRSQLLRDQTFQCHRTVPARYDLTAIFNQAELEKYDENSGFKPDILLSSSSDNKRCFIEICVTHPCSQEKIDSGIPILEFKIDSEADIQDILSGSYSINTDRMSVYNFQPPAKTEHSCNDQCTAGSIDMSVWSLSDSGRLNEHSIPLAEINLSTQSNINTWPKSLEMDQQLECLQKFLLSVDPDSRVPNCVLCTQSSQWSNGYLHCRSKHKRIAYTEARQCIDYERIA